MSYLSKWSLLFEFHKATHRAKIISSLYKSKPIKEKWPYYFAFGTYLLISGSVAFIAPKSIWPVFVIIVTAFLTYLWLETRIAKEYKYLYIENNLKAHPFFTRSTYVSYLLFSEKLNNSKSFEKEDIKTLINWLNIQYEKTDVFSFFKTSVILSAITILVNIVIKYLEMKKLINPELIFTISFLVFSIIWLSWILSEAINSNKKKTSEISRYIKWWELEE